MYMKEGKRILVNDKPTHFLSFLAANFKGWSVCFCTSQRVMKLCFMKAPLM